jgi:hypothetical protein
MEQRTSSEAVERTRPSLRACVTLSNMPLFYTKGLFAPLKTQAEGTHLSALPACLCNIFVATLTSGGRLFNPQPEDHKSVFVGKLSHDIKMFLVTDISL